MPLNPDEIKAIRRATFPRSWGWRGYDRAEVEGFLETVAARLEEADTRERELEKELVRAKARRRRATTTGRSPAAGRSQSRASRRTAQPTRTRRPRASRPAAARAREPIDLNSATFSQFRRVGLGTTVAARLIALRDIRGGFRDLEETRDVESLSDRAFRLLNSRFYVDAEPGSR
jgi:DivIVA domain-containing protein